MGSGAQRFGAVVGFTYRINAPAGPVGVAAGTATFRVVVFAGKREAATSATRTIRLGAPVVVHSRLRAITEKLQPAAIEKVTGDPKTSQTIVLRPGTTMPRVGAGPSVPRRDLRKRVPPDTRSCCTARRVEVLRAAPASGRICRPPRSRGPSQARAMVFCSIDQERPNSKAQLVSLQLDAMTRRCEDVGLGCAWASHPDAPRARRGIS